MLETLQKNVKNSHINGSEVCNNFSNRIKNLGVIYNFQPLRESAKSTLRGRAGKTGLVAPVLARPIDPYHARAKVCCGSKLRLHNIRLPSGGLKCTETQAFGVSGA